MRLEELEVGMKVRVFNRPMVINDIRPNDSFRAVELIWCHGNLPARDCDRFASTIIVKHNMQKGWDD